MTNTLRVFALCALSSSIAFAQVGHVPDKSPYRDIPTITRISTFAGFYRGAKDEAGVLPRNGPLLGLRWDVHVGGPGDIAFRVAHVSTSRNVIDPTRAQGDRIVEDRSLSLGFADVGLSLNLTGNKAWHDFVPMVLGAVGVVSDFKGRDIGGFSHGSTFSFGYGFGMRYAPVNKRLTMRADIGSYMYSLQYPVSYYTIGGDGTSVLKSDVQRGQWRNNWTASFGLSWQLYR